MKRTFSLLLVLSLLIQPVSARAFEDDRISYSDIIEMRDTLLSDEPHSITVSDLVSKYHQLLASYRVFEVSSLEICESNDWFIRNWLSSDYPRELLITDSDVCVTFTTLEGNTILHWNRNNQAVEHEGTDVLYNYDGLTIYTDYSVEVQ